ncbi:MAG: FAD:protein FMN transferase, partial [Gemmataceae bacterium]|nr:FAD:protein FMN transferase [Gemmataceae bacterium]
MLRHGMTSDLLQYTEPMHRREFLLPKQLARTVAQVLDVAGELRTMEDRAAHDAVLLRFARRAMATTFEIVIPFGTTRAHELADAGLNEIDRLESQLTIYRDDSEVSRINAAAADGPVVVEENLFQLLVRCRSLHAATGGAFDVATGALIKAWGFHRRQGAIPPEEVLRQARDQSGFQHVVLDAESLSVAFTKAGVALNFGSIGKGYALDRVVRLVYRAFGVRSLLLHGGHSSVFALGDQPGMQTGWSVGVLDPEEPAQRLGQLRLRNRGLGISAATYQHLIHEGRRLGHVLDPRTGWPAEGMRLAAVT